MLNKTDLVDETSNDSNKWTVVTKIFKMCDILVTKQKRESSTPPSAQLWCYSANWVWERQTMSLNYLKCYLLFSFLQYYWLSDISVCSNVLVWWIWLRKKDKMILKVFNVHMSPVAGLYVYLCLWCVCEFVCVCVCVFGEGRDWLTALPP